MAIDYGEYEVDKEDKQKSRVVNPRGEDIKLTDRQKNELYRKAREMKEKLRDGLCTRNECWNPNERNVNKMINSEMKQSSQAELYKNTMRAIGADPKDVSVEKLRRR